MKALLITASVLFAAVAGVVGWAVVADDPLGGQPVALLAIEPMSETQAEAARPSRPQGAPPPMPGAMTAPERPAGAAPPSALPPGFSVIGLEPSDLTTAAARDPQPLSPPVGADSTESAGPRTLPPVPVDALIQESRYGPLPQLAPDGRRPSEVYARPTRFAGLPKLGEPARIAVVINGLGLSDTATGDGIAKLPAEVTLAFSPYGRNLQGWVRQARDAGHEVMLQIPLEPFDYPDNDPGPHTLLTNLPAEENLKRLQWLLARCTGYVGVTNHMGAKFAASQESFLPVLEELKARGLLYLDDGAAGPSTAAQIARDMGLFFSVAQVHIDATQSPEDIDRKLAKLEKAALEKGLAIGVGTSLPLTIDRVAKWAAKLKSKGIVLVPASAAVSAQHAT